MDRQRDRYATIEIIAAIETGMQESYHNREVCDQASCGLDHSVTELQTHYLHDVIFSDCAIQVLGGTESFFLPHCPPGFQYP